MSCGRAVARALVPSSARRLMMGLVLRAYRASTICYVNIYLASSLSLGGGGGVFVRSYLHVQWH